MELLFCHVIVSRSKIPTNESVVINGAIYLLPLCFLILADKLLANLIKAAVIYTQITVSPYQHLPFNPKLAKQHLAVNC